jgi:dsRNA-specific ribonuclease
MKRLRLGRYSGQLLSSRPQARPRPFPCCVHVQAATCQNLGARRWQSSDVAEYIDEDLISTSSSAPDKEYPSPSTEAALRSAKLAALHARLSLPKKLPLQTMARTLVDPSADADSNFNNLALAQVGGSILSYHVSEWLLCTYPRLPMTVLFAATYAYNGPKTLSLIAKEWGVETAAFPGPEVDAGLLQFSKLASGAPLNIGGGSVRPDRNPGTDRYRRGISSRNVYDDEFGDVIPKEDSKELPQPSETAYSNFVKAVVGSIYVHAGRSAAKSFVQQHVLSRHLNVGSLFAFREPVRELARLCLREDFEYPVARMLSETGRHSRTPVYVVGIFSGTQKLGEGSGSHLVEARWRASIAALKAWYLYSPSQNPRVPSEMEDRNASDWKPVHIDIGEIIH